MRGCYHSAGRCGETEPARRTPSIGALDIGTNSCRLLIVRSNRRNGTEASNRDPAYRGDRRLSPVIVCLGEGLDRPQPSLAKPRWNRTLCRRSRFAPRKLKHRRRVRHMRRGAWPPRPARRASNGVGLPATRVNDGKPGSVIDDDLVRAEEVQLALAGLPAPAWSRRHSPMRWFSISVAAARRSSGSELESGSSACRFLRAWHVHPLRRGRR